MKAMHTFAAALLAAMLAITGCYGTTEVSATVPTPAMVTIGPDVQVVTDYDYPVFYSGGVYYRYYGGTWMRSRYHDRGYVNADHVPDHVRTIRSPEAYTHYRAHPMANRVPDHRHH